MKRIFAIFLFGITNATVCFAQQQIKVSPSNVNVYSQGATTIFLTYGNLGDYRPAETAWCGDIQPATPNIGFICVPGTIYGTLPRRFDVSRRSGAGGYTDVVSVPASVARKAYQAAAAGENSEFFYVRRFTNPNGGPDQFVSATMRLSGNGAGVPFSLTDVQLGFGAAKGFSAGAADPQILFAEPGKKLPPVRAEIRYTGTGRLKGRWEVVRPGDPLPNERDLLSEASLPIEERGTQARFTQLSRFNVFLPPGGRFVLPGPDPERLPASVPGQYLLLLRIEASDDRENDSDLGAAGSGKGIVHSGGATGFPLPVLRYVVGGGDNTRDVTTGTEFAALLPRDGAALPGATPVEFTWAAMPQAAFYRLEVEDSVGRSILSAALKSTARNYRAPSWLPSRLKDKAGNATLRWRVVALDQNGNRIGETAARSLRIIPGSAR